MEPTEQALPCRSWGLLQRSPEARPDSYDGHTLTGDLDYAEPFDAFKVANKEAGRALLDQSIAEYRKAEAIKPGRPAL